MSRLAQARNPEAVVFLCATLLQAAASACAAQRAITMLQDVAAVTDQSAGPHANALYLAAIATQLLIGQAASQEQPQLRMLPHERTPHHHLAIQKLEEQQPRKWLEA